MGYIHVYTGNGKGKTTAAFGLALRHLYAGGSVLIGQFAKSMAYSECQMQKNFNRIVIKQFGKDCFIGRDPDSEDVELARAGLREMCVAVSSGTYSLVVFDEVTIALYYRLFSDEELLDCLASRSKDVEIVLTGRFASQALIDAADLVTEMVEVKHYYQKGVLSRVGIDC